MRRGRRTAPLGRALAVAISAVADQTFKDVVAEAIRKRDLVTKWIVHAGSVDAAVGELCGVLGVDADDTVEQVDDETVERRPIPSSKWLALAQPARCRFEDRSRAAERLRAAPSQAAKSAPSSIAGCSSPKPRRTPRKQVVTGKMGAELCDLFARPNAIALRVVRAAQHHRVPRPHRGAADHRGRGDLALPGREGPARPARLRRPDRQVAHVAVRGSRRLGALQARPGHRPRAGRRGAGHQPEAVGDRPLS